MKNFLSIKSLYQFIDFSIWFVNISDFRRQFEVTFLSEKRKMTRFPGDRPVKKKCNETKGLGKKVLNIKFSGSSEIYLIYFNFRGIFKPLKINVFIKTINNRNMNLFEPTKGNLALAKVNRENSLEAIVLTYC